MIAAAARHRYLVGAGAALVAVVAIIAVLAVAVIDDGAMPEPEFTLNSTTHPIPDGALDSGGSSTTISRSMSSDPVVTIHLPSNCSAKRWIDVPGLTTPARQIWIGESEAVPARQSSSQEEPSRPQSMLPGSFRDLSTVVIVIRCRPELAGSIFLRELREAFERIPLSVRWHLQRLASTRPTKSVVMYFQ